MVHSLKIVAAGLAVFSLSADPALAKEDRASEIADTATICNAMLSDPGQVNADLRAQGWRVTAPSVGGRSMATITGTEQYRRGKDNALVSTPGSMVGANCQFEFAKVSEELHTAVLARLKTHLGEPAEMKSDMAAWKRDGVSYSLHRRSQDKATILWLPDTKASN